MAADLLKASEAARRAGVLDELQHSPAFETMSQAVDWATSAASDNPAQASNTDEN